MAVFRRFAAVLVCLACFGFGGTLVTAQVGSGPASSGSPVPNLFLVGNGQPAVGSAVARLMDGSKIHFVDRSAPDVGPRATIEGGSWAVTLGLVRPGDFVLIQFRRTDGSAFERTDGSAFAKSGSASDADNLPGVGDGALRIAGTSASGRDRIEQTYGWYLRRLAVEAIARGATPIVCAPVIADATEQARDEEWAGAIAMQQRIPFADVPAAARQARVGTVNGSGDGALLPEVAGTALMAALRGLPQSPLAGYFSAEGNAVAPYHPPPAPTTPPL